MYSLFQLFQMLYLLSHIKICSTRPEKTTHVSEFHSQCADPHPSPLPLHEGRQVEITPLLPTDIGDRFSQTISNLLHAALITPPINESAELTRGAL